MTSFFPDLNVWLALSVAGHVHNGHAWRWLKLLPKDARVMFSRYTQIGLLRLLTNSAVMGEETLTLNKAWGIYDQWQDDPRVEFHPEPRTLDATFRAATMPFGNKPASKSVGDCYLLAFSREIQATLVTFDAGLLSVARKQHCAAIIPA